MRAVVLRAPGDVGVNQLPDPADHPTFRLTPA